MQTIDIIIAVLLAVGVGLGLKEGLVKQIAGLAGLIGGLLLGRAFYTPVGEWLASALGMSEEASHVVAFIVMLVVVPLLFSLLGWMVEKWLRAASLNWANRLLGGLVGMLKFALLVGVFITGFEFFDPRDVLIAEEKKEASVLYYPIHKATSIFFAGLKKEMAAR